jgi:hypothetical protein
LQRDHKFYNFRPGKNEIKWCGLFSGGEVKSEKARNSEFIYVRFYCSHFASVEAAALSSVVGVAEIKPAVDVGGKNGAL